MRSERSSAAWPASGLAMTAQAATRVTAADAGSPPSAWITSRTTTMRRSSMSASGQKREILAENELGVAGRQRLAHEVHRVRLAQRKRRIAAHEEMLHGCHLRGVTKDVGLEADGVEIEPPQIIADRHLQRRRQPGIGVDLPLHARAQHEAEGARMSADELQRRPAIEEPRADHAQDIVGVV